MLPSCAPSGPGGNTKNPIAGTYFEDLAKLPVLTVEAVCATLKSRLECGIPYTFIGPVLLAVNPFQSLAIDSASVVQTYLESSSILANSGPHPFAMAARALNELKTGQPSQKIFPLGESGSGKSEQTKLITKFVLAATSTDTDVFCDEMFQDAEVIIEAFGNALTPLNENSSRFGRALSINLHPARDHIVSASLRIFLFERTRVSSPPPETANFHILHQLCHDSFGEDTRGLVHKTFRLIPTTTATHHHRALTTTRKALLRFLSRDQIEQLFDLLAAVIHLGEVSIPSTTLPPDFELDVHLIHAARLFRIDVKTLAQLVKADQIAVKGVASFRSYRAAESSVVRDSVLTSLYESVFQWMVAVINKALCPDPTVMLQTPRTLQILDMPGFENMTDNSLEQVFINCANQSFHVDPYSKTVLQHIQSELIQDGLPIPSPMPFDRLAAQTMTMNQVLDKLDDQSKSRAGCDEGRKHDLPAAVTVTSGTFLVDHYAGEVKYTLAGLVEKNRRRGVEVLAPLGGGANPVLQAVLESIPNHASNTIKTRVKTAVGQFRQDLRDFESLFSDGQVHFIRCLKPNRLGQAGMYENDYMSNQLLVGGIIDTIELLRDFSYTHQRTLEGFVSRYISLLRPESVERLSTPGEIAREILENRCDPHSFVVGGGTVFMQSGVLFELESNLAQSAEVDSRESDSSTATNAPALTPIVLHQELPDIDSDPDSSTYLGDDFSFIRQLPLDVLPASAESSRVELPYSIQDLYAENVSLSADLTAARESIARLELENDRLRADLEEDKRSSTEIIEKLRSQLNDMEASMSTVRAMHGSKVESMRLQIQELEDQAKTRTATIGQLSTDGAILRQEVERMQSKEKHLVQERDASLNREASALKRLSVAGQRLDSAERDVRLASASQLLSWQQCNRLLTLVVLAMPLKQQGNDSQEQIGTPKELAVIIRSVMEGLSRGGKLEDISSVWGALRRRMTQGDVANSVRSPLFIISTVHQLLDSESEPLGADSQLRHTLSQIKDDLFAIAQEQMARGLKLRIMNVSAPLAREQLPITLEELLRNIRQSWTSADLEREGCILLEAAFGAIGEAGLEVIERASNSAQTSSQEQNYRTLLRALATSTLVPLDRAPVSFKLLAEKLNAF